MGLIKEDAEFSRKGVELLDGKKGGDNEDGLEQWPSISTTRHFEQYMPFSHFKDFQRFLRSIFADESRKESDHWWDF
jgi:hypothetical protein